MGVLAARAGMPAVAIDRPGRSVRGAGVFRRAKDAGVQPIIGCALPVIGSARARRSAGRARRPWCCWRRTRPASRNLMALSSAGLSRDRAADEPHVSWATLAAHAEGLILLVRRARRAGRSAVRRGRSARRRGRRWQKMEQRLRRPLLRRGATPRPGVRGGRRAAAWSTTPMSTTCRWSPPTTSISPPSRNVPRARRAACASPSGAFLGEDERRRVTPEHWFKPRRRDARGCSPTCRRPATTPSTSRAAAPSW